MKISKAQALWALGVVAVGAAAVGSYLWFQSQDKPRPAPAPPPVVAAPPPPTLAPAPEPESPVIEHPIEPPLTATALPMLSDSDKPVQQAVAGLMGSKPVRELVNGEGLVRRIVATVDALPRQKLAPRILPVKPVAGTFLTTKSEDEFLIGAGNAQRYSAYIRLFEAIDSKQLAAVYRYFYPLFQQAYRELGYPKGYFNDRLVEVIDHLLAAPDAAPAIKLVQPKVLYEFADPALEERSAGQKIMMRMGRDNAKRVKTKLRELRQEIARKEAAK